MAPKALPVRTDHGVRSIAGSVLCNALRQASVIRAPRVGINARHPQLPSTATAKGRRGACHGAARESRATSRLWKPAAAQPPSANADGTHSPTPTFWGGAEGSLEPS